MITNFASVSQKITDVFVAVFVFSLKFINILIPFGLCNVFLFFLLWENNSVGLGHLLVQFCIRFCVLSTYLLYCYNDMLHSAFYITYIFDLI